METTTTIFSVPVPGERTKVSILSFLNWNDLLRLRRVSKATKAIADGYINAYPELGPEIEIDEESEEKSFAAFLKTGLSSDKFFLNNPSGDGIYSKDPENVEEFLVKFGPVIKQLRVEQLSVVIFGKEWDFLERLVNLQHFEAGHFGYGRKGSSDDEVDKACEKLLHRVDMDPGYLAKKKRKLPKVFKQLKSLKIGQENDTFVDMEADRVCNILETCQELEILTLPLFAKNWSAIRNATNFGPSYAGLLPVFVFISKYINDRAFSHPDKPNLKIFDCVHYHTKMGVNTETLNLTLSMAFPDFAMDCVDNGVKLMNVNPLWFQQNNEERYGYLIEHGLAVGSLVNFHHVMVNLFMSNLERIEIRSTLNSNVELFMLENRQTPPSWFSNFASLDITVDSKISKCQHWDNFGERHQIYDVPTKSIFRFLFEADIPLNITELRLNFSKEDGGSVAVPKRESIVTACPHLKKLTLIKWPGTSKALVTLFEGLQGLEEISLEYCPHLRNLAFVGEDTSDPVFLKLTKLKKLSLKGLDQMPKITDLLFNLVLRHLQLSHFILTADAPLTSFTSAGILSLLEGSFAGSIEKFPFTGWSMAGVSAEEFKQLEMKFRSYRML